MDGAGGNLAGSYDMGNGRVSGGVECSTRLFYSRGRLLERSGESIDRSARPDGCSKDINEIRGGSIDRSGGSSHR